MVQWRVVCGVLVFLMFTSLGPYSWQCDLETAFRNIVSAFPTVFISRIRNLENVFQ